MPSSLAQSLISGTLNKSLDSSQFLINQAHLVRGCQPDNESCQSGNRQSYCMQFKVGEQQQQKICFLLPYKYLLFCTHLNRFRVQGLGLKKREEPTFGAAFLGIKFVIIVVRFMRNHPYFLGKYSLYNQQHRRPSWPQLLTHCKACHVVSSSGNQAGGRTGQLGLSWALPSTTGKGSSVFWRFISKCVGFLSKART